jgi:hypothetical protein
VFEQRSQKTKSKQQKRGEFFDARSAGLGFGYPKGGDVGSHFFGYFLWRDKESN